jgi:uncharacterized protein YegP (UPF0339 family)
MSTQIPYYETYQDASLGWRWRLRGANHLIVAVSSEAYSSKYEAEKSRDWIAYWAGRARKG